MWKKGRISVDALVYVVNVLDILGASMVVPLLPHQAKSLGASAYVIGLVGSIYGALQLVGSPVMGRLSDLWGRKAVLMLSLVGTAFSYAMQANASSLTMLILSRIPVGVLKQSMSVSQAVITDMTTKEMRLAAIARSNAAIALGFIVGPALGGHLSQYGFYLPMYVASCIFLANTALVYWCFPHETEKSTADIDISSFTDKFQQQLAAAEATNNGNDDDNDGGDSKKKKNNIDINNKNKKKTASIFAALSVLVTGSHDGLSRESRILLALRMCTSLSNQLFRRSFSLLTLAYGLNPQNSGFVMSYVGVIGLCVQQFAVPILGKTTSDTKMVWWCVVVTVVVQVILGCFSNLYLFLIGLVPLSFATGVTRTASISLVTKAAPPDLVGFVLGLSGSVDSVSRMMSPSIGGLLISNFGEWSVFWVSGVLVLPVPILLKMMMAEGHNNNNHHHNRYKKDLEDGRGGDGGVSDDGGGGGGSSDESGVGLLAESRGERKRRKDAKLQV